MSRRRVTTLAGALACGLLATGAGTGARPAAAAEEATEMTEPTLVHHQINYIEFSVRDMAEAQRFYAAAFGWSFTDYGPDYAGIRKSEGEPGEQGGLRRVEEGVASGGGPLVILYSADLEASLESVRRAGGEIVVPPFSFPGGRRFHFRDPSGNVLAVWGAGAGGD